MKIRLPRDDRHWHALLVGIAFVLFIVLMIVLGLWVGARLNGYLVGFQD